MVSETFKSERALKNHQIILLNFTDEEMEAQDGHRKTLKDFKQGWANRALLLNSLIKFMGETKQRLRDTTID